MDKKAQIFGLNKLTLVFIFIIVILLFFGFGGPASILSSFNQKPVATNIVLMTDTSQYSIYKIKFSSTEGDNGCKGIDEGHMKEQVIINKANQIFTLRDTDYKLDYDISNLERGVDSEFVSGNLNSIRIGAVAYCSGPSEPITIKNREGTCNVNSRDNTLNCAIEYDVETNARSGSVSGVSGDFTIKMYKEGFVPVVVEEPETIETIETDSAGNPIPQTSTSQTEELSFFDKINLWIQNFLNRILG